MIDVVMVSHDREKLVLEALPSLLASPLVGKVHVVDNASSDDLPEQGPLRFPEVDWILLSNNEGCVAWNTGMNRVESQFALILDDDCVPDFASLRSAYERLSAGPDIGLAVFNILNHESGESEWDFLECLDGSSGWHNAIGACLLVRVDAYQQVGGYKDYFLCFNDLDLVLSLWEAGFRVLYDKGWKAFHKRPAGHHSHRFYWEVRNFTATMWSHLGPHQAVPVILNYTVRAFWKASRQRQASAVLRAFRDGMELGRRLDRGRKQPIPDHVRRMLWVNFFWGRRALPALLPEVVTPGA